MAIDFRNNFANFLLYVCISYKRIRLRWVRVIGGCFLTANNGTQTGFMVTRVAVYGKQHCARLRPLMPGRAVSRVRAGKLSEVSVSLDGEDVKSSQMVLY